MKLFSAIGLAVSVLLAASSPAWAQPPEAKRNPGGISMKSVLSLNQSGIGPKVIGGREAKSVDWPASFVSEFTDQAGQKWSCTATMIGPKVLLFAAHCVGNGQQVTIDILGKSISGTCTHAPEWKDGTGDPSADYALCKMGDPVADVVFETVNIDPSRIVNGENLLLTGFGCIQAAAPGQQFGSGGNDGIFRIGEAKIAALPGEEFSQCQQPTLMVKEPNTILTRDKAMVCQGDSGGGAYLVLTSTKRLLVGVNSRVCFDNGSSYLSSISSINGLAFIKQWVQDNGEKVCGINLSGSACK